VSSLPEEIQEEMYRMLSLQNKEITLMTLGEIHQTCLVALDKLYSTELPRKNFKKSEEILQGMSEEISGNQMQEERLFLPEEKIF